MPTSAEWIQRLHDLANETQPQQKAAKARSIVQAALAEAEAHPHRPVPPFELEYRNIKVPFDIAVPIWRGGQDAYTALSGHGPTRVVGECWGMSPLGHPVAGGTLLRTGEPAGQSRVEWREQSRIRCALGSTFEEVNECAAGGGRNLANVPGFSGLTVAGCIGVGGHGSGLQHGPLSSMVERIQFGSPVTGQTTAGEREYLRGGPNFDLAVCHLGRLGPVREIDLSTVEAYDIVETRTLAYIPAGDPAALATLLTNVLSVQGWPDVHSAEVWIAPYPEDGSYTATIGVRERAAPAPLQLALPLANRNPALVMLGYLVSLLANQLDDVVETIPTLIRTAVESTAHDEVHMSGIDGLDFGYANSVPAASIELAIDLGDVSYAARALGAVLDQLNALAAGNPHLYLLSPIGIRFTGPVADGSLAPQAGRAQTMHVELPTFNHECCRPDAVLAPVQRYMATTFDARPHWGQRIYLTAAELARLWREDTRQAFRALVQLHDPTNRFANPLLDEMLEV